MFISQPVPIKKLDDTTMDVCDVCDYSWCGGKPDVNGDDCDCICIGSD